MSVPQAERGRFSILVMGVHGENKEVDKVATTIVSGLKALNDQVFGALPAGTETPLKSFEILTMAGRLGLAEEAVRVTLEDDGEAARRVLAKTGASLLIDVQELVLEDKTRHSSIYLAGKFEETGRGRFPLSHYLEITPSSVSDVLPLIQLAVLTEAGQWNDRAGRFLVPRLEPIMQKVEAVFATNTNLSKIGVHSPGAAQWILGNTQFECGLYADNPAYVERAQSTFGAILGKGTSPQFFSDRYSAFAGMVRASQGQTFLATGRPGVALLHFEHVLMDLKRSQSPLQWATTKVNQGIALTRMGEQNGNADDFRRAQKAFLEALEVLTRQAYPLEWAALQRHIGQALTRVGTIKNDVKALNDALYAFGLATQELTRERSPLEWGSLQNDAAGVFSEIGSRESGPERFEDAVKTYEDALSVLSREKTPQAWMITQSNRSDTLRLLGERKKDAGILCRALQSHLEIMQLAKQSRATDLVDAFRMRVELDVKAIDPNAPSKKPTCTPAITDELWSVFQPSTP